MKKLLSIAVGGITMCLSLAQAEETGVERTVLLDNESVLVTETHFKPSGVNPLHSHGQRVVYFLEGGVLVLTNKSGESKRIDVPTGRTLWRPPATHVSKNIGDSNVRVLVMELK